MVEGQRPKVENRHTPWAPRGEAFDPRLSTFDSPDSCLQHLNERLLRNIHRAEGFHAFFAFLLFFEQLAFARDVAAVALGRHVFSERTHGFAGDDLAADGPPGWPPGIAGAGSLP